MTDKEIDRYVDILRYLPPEKHWSYVRAYVAAVHRICGLVGDMTKDMAQLPTDDEATAQRYVSQLDATLEAVASEIRTCADRIDDLLHG